MDEVGGSVVAKDGAGGPVAAGIGPPSTGDWTVVEDVVDADEEGKAAAWIRAASASSTS